MSRMIQDDELRVWEAFASTGPFGSPDRSHIVFYCVTDPGLRPRFVDSEGDKTDAERAVETLPDPELATLLEQSREVA